MTVRNAIAGLVAAFVVALFLLAPPYADAAEKGVAVRFGGSGSPFGEAIKDYEKTRYYRHFGFGGHFFYRVPSNVIGEGSFLGLRLSTHHLTNDARLGGTAIGIFGQFPILLTGEIGAETGGFWYIPRVNVILRAGGGVNLTSFGNGRMIFDLEEAKLVTIGVDTKTSPALTVGAGVEYPLSKLTSIAFDTDLILGNVETTWRVSGASVSEPFPYENADLHVRHFAVMLGVNILLAGGEAE